MIDILNNLNFDVFIIVKIFILIFLALVAVFSFIFAYQVHSLNKVVRILASFSSGLLQTVTYVYLLIVISLFFISLVIL